MFNRHLEMRLKKNEKTAPTSANSDTSFEEKVAAAAYVGETVVNKAALGVAGYVILDTVRKVLITMAAK